MFNNIVITYLQLCLFLWKSKQSFELIFIPQLAVSCASGALGLGFLSNGVSPCRCPKRYGRVYGNLLRLVGLKANVAKKGTVC